MLTMLTKCQTLCEHGKLGFTGNWRNEPIWK